LGLYDEKIMIEATLFGLPMFRVSVPNPDGALSTRSSSLSLSTSSMVRTTDGLIAKSLIITPTFSEVTTAEGRYYAVGGEVQANGGRPIQPRLSLDIAETGTRARGIVFLEGHYSDIDGFDPVIARPVTDTTLTEPGFMHGGWYPSRLAVLNRIETAGGVLQRLVVVPGQYSNPGTQRLWNSLTYEVYYSTGEDVTPPTVWRVEGVRTLRHAGFTVVAMDDSGIERVVVTYSFGEGHWRSLDLAYNAESVCWQGVLDLGSAKRAVHYFVQAVDRAGNASSTNNKGLFFELVTHNAYLPVVTRGQ
jgi:hypothetical protein